MNRRLLSVALMVTVMLLVLASTVLAETVPPGEIPEAGSLLMLGTGLAGFAGYVGLRWRARK